MRKTVAATFEQHFEYQESTGCIEWVKYTTPAGYGRLRYEGRLEYSHRLMYLKYVGEVPKGMVIMHSCDNPPCANVKHLSIGTHQDNMDDREAKWRGRGVYPKPPKYTGPPKITRLTPTDVRDIRRLSAAGMSGHAIAKELGLRNTAVGNVITGKTYKDLS